jgi:hypothetical protein
LSGGVFFFLRERMISPSYVQPTEGAGMDPQQSPACTGPAVPSFPHVGPSSDENVRVESWKNEPRRKKNGLVVVSRPTAADSGVSERDPEHSARAAAVIAPATLSSPLPPSSSCSDRIASRSHLHLRLRLATPSYGNLSLSLSFSL